MPLTGFLSLHKLPLYAWVCPSVKRGYYLLWGPPEEVHYFSAEYCLVSERISVSLALRSLTVPKLFFFTLLIGYRLLCKSFPRELSTFLEKCTLFCREPIKWNLMLPRAKTWDNVGETGRISDIDFTLHKLLFVGCISEAVHLLQLLRESRLLISYQKLLQTLKKTLSGEENRHTMVKAPEYIDISKTVSDFNP